MRDRAYLDFVRDRVVAEIAANPSIRPYLGETTRARSSVCKQGHERVGRCLVCAAAYKRQKRASGEVAW